MHGCTTAWLYVWLPSNTRHTMIGGIDMYDPYFTRFLMREREREIREEIRRDGCHARRRRGGSGLSKKIARRLLSIFIKIEPSPRQAAENLHRMDEDRFPVRSPIPPQATGKALAIAVLNDYRSRAEPTAGKQFKGHA